MGFWVAGCWQADVWDVLTLICNFLGLWSGGRLEFVYVYMGSFLLRIFTVCRCHFLPNVRARPREYLQTHSEL